MNDELREVKKELAKEIFFNDYIGTDLEELHNAMYNSDYYIIGYYEAEQFLKSTVGVFNAIGIVKEYEQDNFGEVNTVLSSPEHVCNMLVYIAGEELLSELGIYDYSGELTEEIAEELQEKADNY